MGLLKELFCVFCLSILSFAAVLAAGTAQDGGILPRSLATIFNSVGDRLYQAMDLKPALSTEVMWLDSRQVRQEETKRQMLLQGGLWEVSRGLWGFNSKK